MRTANSTTKTPRLKASSGTEGSKHQQHKGHEAVERRELVQNLARRLRELRGLAGMRQEDVAEARGLSRKGRTFISRLERKGVATATLVSVADYLRAVRAGFRDLKPVLDRYTSVPIPRQVQQRAAAAAKPRFAAPPHVLAALPWTGSVPALAFTVTDERSAKDLLRIRRRAGYWVLRRFLELFMHNALNAVGIPGAHWLRRRMATYGRRVFSMLFFTRGSKEKTRPERLERLRRSARRLQLNETLSEFIEAVVTRLFEDMRKENELDWHPEPADAVELMSRKPSRRVVTDRQLCRAEWQEVWSRYSTAVAEIDRRGHEATEKLLAGCEDARLLQHYRVVVTWATRIGADTAAGTPQRERSLKTFREWQFPPQLDRGLLDRLLAAVLETWDSARPTLPPSPGPMP